MRSPITIELYAIAKDLVGEDSVIVEVEDECSASQLTHAIAEQYPVLAPILPSCRLAINDCYVADEMKISCNHRTALIPPVSGG